MTKTTVHTASWIISPKSEPIAGGAIAVRDGRIADMGTASDMTLKYTDCLVEHAGYAIIPGFVNAHTHLELTHFSAWKEQNSMGYSPRSFIDWIVQVIKINRSLTQDQLHSSFREGIRKCLQSGTTAVGDILSRYELLPLYSDSMLGGRFYLELIGQNPSLFKGRFEQAKSIISSQNKQSGISPGLSPHSAYTVAEENLKIIQNEISDSNIPFAIHLSESEAESEFMFDSTGAIAEIMYPLVHWQEHLSPARHCSSTDFFDKNHLFSEKTMAVHCVHISSADARKLKERGVSICLCPRSNERLDVGVAPAALFKKLHIPMALGTDSLASNDSLSIWDEMRFALDKYKGVFSSEDIFEMATIGGARALLLTEHIGSLAIGKNADFQLVEIGDNLSADKVLESLIEQGETAEVYRLGKKMDL